MTLQTPSHEDSCTSGFGVYLAPKQDDRYILVPFHKCRWSCDAQAYYRIGRVAEQAMYFHDELTWNWLDDDARRNLRERARNNDLGYMSITVTARVDKFIICAPDLMLTQPAMPAKELFSEAIPQLVDIGITRMDKAKLWAPDVKGYDPLVTTKRTDRLEVEQLMATAGFVNGHITIDRPIEYHVEALAARLAETINL